MTCRFSKALALPLPSLLTTLSAPQYGSHLNARHVTQLGEAIRHAVRKVSVGRKRSAIRMQYDNELLAALAGRREPRASGAASSDLFGEWRSGSEMDL